MTEGDPAAADVSAYLPLFHELGDLKRVRSAGRQGSIAVRLFRQAWGDLTGGRVPRDVALATTARALAAALLGDLDRPVLSAAGVSRAQITRVLQTAVATVAGAVPDPLRAALIEGVGADPNRFPGTLPPFVAALEAQPRAGVTCPGRPRIVLEPPENHAEHCLVVAVYGVLLSPHYGADPAAVFLAGLAHHFHNAGMPDSGFTGEVLLGPFLDRVVGHYAEACLDQLDVPLRDLTVRARAILPNAGTPEGRAFHAADVIDRVLQIGQHLRAATLTMDQVLGEMALVHDGPVKPFHDAVLAEAGLP